MLPARPTSASSSLLVLLSVIFITLIHLKGSHAHLLSCPYFQSNPVKGQGVVDCSEDASSFVEELEISGDIQFDGCCYFSYILEV